MVVGEKAGANKHEHSPDGHTHEHTDVGSLLCVIVILGCEIALHDCLVGAVFLKRVENTVEHHDYESQLSEVPVVGAHVDFVVFTGNAEHLGRTSFGGGSRRPTQMRPPPMRRPP